MGEPAQKHRLGGAAVIVAIISRSKILLIKETTKPEPHYWKLVGESLEPNESVLNALWGGVREEAGLQIEALRDHTGQVVSITDSRIRMVKELLSPKEIKGNRPHTRHVWGILTTDEVINSLSGAQLRGDDDEEIYTQSFALSELENMRDFHPAHRDILLQLKEGLGH